MSQTNPPLDYTKLSGVGFIESIDSLPSIFKRNEHGTITSFDNEVLFYVYFEDMVDLEALEVKGTFSHIQVTLYPNMGLDLGSCFEEESSYISRRTGGYLKLKLEGVDRFVLHLKSDEEPLNINRVTFYGRKSRRFTQNLERLIIVWGPGCGLSDGTSLRAGYGTSGKVARSIRSKCVVIIQKFCCINHLSHYIS